MVEQLEGLMRQSIRQLIANIKSDNSSNTFDLVQDLAFPSPTEVICHMIGIPAPDRLQFEQWTRDLSISVQADFHHIDDASREMLNSTALQITSYFEKLISHKINEPKDDLMSRFIEEHANSLSHHELLSNCVFLLFAGQETTASLIGNAMNALLSNPDQLEALRKDHGLISNAVDECLRFDPSIQMIGRLALEDFVVNDLSITKGDHVFAFIGAAGRDPAANDNPNTFDVNRTKIKHLAFARGVHHCLGSSLAKLEIRVFLEEILDAFDDLEFIGQPKRRETWLMRGLESLPVRYRDAQSKQVDDSIRTIALPSERYPFIIKDLPRFTQKGYLFENVYQKITDEQRHACVNFWIDNGAISNRDAAWNRSKEICYMIYHSESGQLIGVNTLYTDTLTKDGETFFFNRMFMATDHRHLSLSTTGTALMLCFAKTHLSHKGVRGIINVNENRKLSGPALQRLFSRLGYKRVGWQDENEVIFFEFSRIEFTEAR
jgi:cytochrome P450